MIQKYLLKCRKGYRRTWYEKINCNHANMKSTDINLEKSTIQWTPICHFGFRSSHLLSTQYISPKFLLLPSKFVACRQELLSIRDKLKDLNGRKYFSIQNQGRKINFRFQQTRESKLSNQLQCDKVIFVFQVFKFIVSDFDFYFL